MAVPSTPLHGAEGEVPVFAVLHKGCSFPKITPGAAASGFFQRLCPFPQHLLPAPRAGGQAQGREGAGGDVRSGHPWIMPGPVRSEGGSSRGGAAVPNPSSLQGLRPVPKEVSHSPGVVSPGG